MTQEITFSLILWVALYFTLQMIEQHIQVIHNDGERKWTVIESKTMKKEKSNHIYLGHVGEFHYVSLRPSQLHSTFCII